MEIIVIGGGLAAASAVQELREQGHHGGLVMLAGEPHLPYERPPLSKGVLLGEATSESTRVLDQQWYDDHAVEVRTGTAATGIDLERCLVRVGEEDLSYDRLLIATGATPRRLPDLDGHDLPVLTLRTVEDAAALKESLHGTLLILGAGWIGLEVAAAARLAGAEVTVVDPAEQPLRAALGPELGRRFADLHRGHGVDLRLGVTVAGVDGRRVRLSDGDELTPDLVLVGIGAVPEDRLAREAGLTVDGGIWVDAALRASEPHVYAAGDVAAHDHPVLGRRVRVEHWDNAIHQGRAAARAMLGADEAYTRQPYFFTDQYDVGIEYVGSIGPHGYDDVLITGDLVAGLRAYWVGDGRIIAAMHANDWDAIETIRASVGQPVPDDLADLS